MKHTFATGAFAVVGLALLLGGCTQETKEVKTDPDFWKPESAADKDAFVITDSVEVKDTEANALQELEESARKTAVALTIRDLVRDDKRLASREDELRTRFLEQFQRYVESCECVQKATFQKKSTLMDKMTTRFGAKFKVRVKRGDLGKDLQAEGVFRKDQGALRVVVVLRKPAPNTEVSELAAGYLDDLAEGLSRELLERGFQPKLWKDVRLSVAERRDMPEADVAKMLQTYVEDSDWHKPDDERYELPLILLRAEGRLLVGFRILELEKKELACNCLIRADAYDLLNGQSLGYETETGRAVIGDKNATLVQARQAAVSDTSSRCMAKLCNRLQEFLDQQRRARADAAAYELTFEGYDAKQLARIESLLAGIVAEDIQTKNDGVRLVATAPIPRAPIPVRDEIARSLKVLGLASKPPRSDGTKLFFVRE